MAKKKTKKPEDITTVTSAYTAGDAITTGANTPVYLQTITTTTSSPYGGSTIAGLTINSGQYSHPFTTSGSLNVIPRIPCQHVTAVETAEYIDGTVYANCTLCAERIQIARLPGGLALVAAKSLVAALTLGVEDDSLKLLNELSDQLEANRQALEEFEGLVDIARRMVRESCG